MLRIVCIVLLANGLALSLGAQGKYYTKSGKLSFFSSTPLEDISAINKNAVMVLDVKSGDIQVAALVKGFEFKKALMQEHFNDSYMESSKLPKTEFKGQVINNNEIDYGKDGTYTARVKGQLIIHGVSREIELPGTITVKDGRPSIFATFSVAVADYNITIEKLYRDNIAKSIKITVDCILAPL